MSTFVPFFCPTHGQVMEAPAHSLVECGCGRDCAPEGVTPAAHRKLYLATRRKRDNRSAKGQVRAS